jgi:hypothetical protein
MSQITLGHIWLRLGGNELEMKQKRRKNETKRVPRVCAGNAQKENIDWLLEEAGTCWFDPLVLVSPEKSAFKFFANNYEMLPPAQRLRSPKGAACAAFSKEEKSRARANHSLVICRTFNALARCANEQCRLVHAFLAKNLHGTFE